MSKRTVKVVPADSTWPQQFAQEVQLLREVLGSNVMAVHHMGSTSVPDLPAKPIIDMLVEVQDLAPVDHLTAAMQAQGYAPQGEKGIPGRRFFQKGGNQRMHHVHIYRSGDAQVARHLAFRDYLRAHPAVCSEYSQLKLSLAQAHHESPLDYQSGKDAFLKRHEAKALEWAKQSR